MAKVCHAASAKIHHLSAGFAAATLRARTGSASTRD
ncbi:MAG: hypothetical protein QOF46_2238 [Paraburkholderia sp.]|nr:hypothetical protein [Paraburkholderia sp.]